LQGTERRTVANQTAIADDQGRRGGDDDDDPFGVAEALLDRAETLQHLNRPPVTGSTSERHFLSADGVTVR